MLNLQPWFDTLDATPNRPRNLSNVGVVSSKLSTR